MSEVREERKPLSRILRELCADPDEVITLGEIMQAFGRRSFGAMLFVFSIPNLLPLPPGSTTVLGAPIAVLAPQVAIGRRTPWLPKALNNRPIKASDLERLLGRMLPTLERIEKLSKPRLLFLFGPVGDRLIGLICTLLALVLILPIPLGNLLPAATIGVLSLALFQRDGLIAIVGYVMAAISGGLLFIGAQVMVLLFREAMRMIGLQPAF